MNARTSAQESSAADVVDAVGMRARGTDDHSVDGSAGSMHGTMSREMLRLQRVAGNGAVTRLLASRPPAGPRAAVQRIPTAAELDASYHQSVLDGDWGKAAEALNGFNAGDITTRVTALSHEQREALYGGAPNWTVPVFDGIARVDQPAAYDGAVRRRDWVRAITALATFDDAGMAAKVAALAGPDRAAMRAACPEPQARVRSALLDVDYKAAVAGARWNEAAGHLNGFNDADITTRVTALTHEQRIALWVGSPKRIDAIIATVDPDAAYLGAVQYRDFTQAAVYLNGFSPPDIASRVAALSVADRAALRAGCPEWAAPVRSAILDVGYRAAVAAPNWTEAAQYLNGFNDADITARITTLSHAQRIAFYPSAPQRIVDIIAAVDLDAAYHGALDSSSWAHVAIHLNGFSDPDIATRVVAMSAAQNAATLAACPTALTRVRIALIGMPVNPTGSIPYDHAPQSSPGERIIFNSALTHANPAQFKLVYSGTGGTFGAVGGAATTTINGLASGNVNFFIDAAWTGTAATTVKLEIRLTDDTVVSSESWTFAKKPSTPATMIQQETEGDRPLGSFYTYQLGPKVAPAGTPDYEHQTILERFDVRTCNITVADLKPAYATANSLTNDAAVCAHFFGTSSNNGTFTVDSNDQVFDVHNGMPGLARFTPALKTMKVITCDLPQTYEVQPGVALAKFTIRRILRVDGTQWLNKIKTL